MDGTSINPTLSVNDNPMGNADCSKISKIVYYKFVFDLDEDGNLVFGIDDGGGIQISTDISSFLKNIMDGVEAYDFSIKKPPSPLDFTIYSPCHVVLELDRSKNWQFMKGSAAIRMKDDCKSRYANLFHSTKNNPNGTPTSSSATERCNIIHFCATDPEPPMQSNCTPDPSNLYIEFFQTDDNSNITRVLPIVIDPDIQNSGPHQ